VSIRQAQRLAEARDALHALDFDGPRSNERSALVLLALLDLTPTRPWAKADGSQRLRIVEIMQWLHDHYGKDYAPNSRETIRRQTLHQFVDAGLVLRNPDDLERPVNSDQTCYQVAPEGLALLRRFGTTRFERTISAYLTQAPSLRARYAMERQMRQIPVTLMDGQSITLTPGGQNTLIAQIIEEFCSRWTPSGKVLYVGDTGREDPVFDTLGLADLGVRLDKHGKLPDLAVHVPERNWLVLLEAASSHGPVDAKRHAELSKLFAHSTAGLIFVSCFPSRAEMRKYLADIAWETEAWCADNPDHLIHFNGERFLGPYS
jgi:hypothetical protein